MTTGRVFYQKISPLKGHIAIDRTGLRRAHARTPFVLPALAIRASHSGNPGSRPWPCLGSSNTERDSETSKTPAIASLTIISKKY